MCAHRIACAVSIALLLVAGQAHVAGQARAAQYSVVDLGYLPNSDPNAAGSEGLGIDNTGEAAASSDIGPFTTHGMYWSGTSASDLDSPSSTVNTFVHGMGPTGKIVGENGSGFAFVWNHGSGFTYLTNLGGTTGAAFGTNATGDVVGTNTQGSLVYGVVWKLATGAPTQLTPADSKFFAMLAPSIPAEPSPALVSIQPIRQQSGITVLVPAPGPRNRSARWAASAAMLSTLTRPATWSGSQLDQLKLAEPALSFGSQAIRP